MIWFQLFMWVASFIISDYFREKLPSVTASGVGDFNIPTATEGRIVPIAIGGTMRCNAPNCIWYGDFIAEEITVTTGVIFRDDETVGYKYRLALQYALFKTQVAGITGVWLGDDELYRGVATDVVDIDRPDLFGGEKSGGGFEGRIRLFDGSPTQGVSAFLNTRISPLSAYRGTSYVMVTSLDETEGAVIGESNNLRHLKIEVQTMDTLANGGLNNTLGLTGDKHIIGADSNPISVAYEYYVNNDWGRRFPPSDIDSASFIAAADTCYDEGIGFGLVIDEITTTGNIQDIIEQHIDGYIGPNPITGRIEVQLARQDYVIANEFQATSDNILEVKKWNRGDWSQTYNKIRVRYADRDKQWNESHAVELASGNRIIQGKNKVKDLRYEGVHDATVAAKMAARSKRSLSQPVDSGTLVLNREAYALRPGNVVAVTTPKIPGSAMLPTRVTKVGVGNVTMNSIEVDVVLDVFDSESNTVAVPPGTDLILPTQDVVPFATADQAATEPPFVLMRLNPLPNTIPRLATFARRTGGAPTEYEVIRRTRATFGSGGYGSFASSGFVTQGFMTCGELRNAEGDWESGNGGLSMQIDPIAGSLDGLIDVYDPTNSNAAGIAVISPGLADEEWVAFTSIVDDLAGIRLEGLWRAAMDTPMVAHASGARIWFIWTGGLGMPSETYSAGSGVEAKFLPRSPSDAVIEGDATALAEVHMLDTGRNARPLLPRTLEINGNEFPTTSQSADFEAQTSPSIILGLLFAVTPRLWRTQHIIDNASGLDLTGGPIALEDWTPENMELEWWLYDLDTTPSPVRDTDDILTGSFNWDQPTESWIVSRDEIRNAGITTDFAARIEIETKHSPNGQVANQISRVPMIFDFDVTGNFTASLFDSVVFLSHFDGTDAATTADDISPVNATMTFVDNAQIDTAQSVFGGASLLLDGAGDCVTCPNDPLYKFADADFTIDARVRFASGASGVDTIASFWDWNGANDNASWIMRHSLSANSMQFTYSTTGANNSTVSWSWTPSTETWYTLRLCRVGNFLYFFVDGTIVGSGQAFSSTLYESDTALLMIGGWESESISDPFEGHIEEVRIINGIGLSDASYTVDPNGFFYTEVTLLCDFDGTDGQTSFYDQSLLAAQATFVDDAQLDTAQSKFGGSSLLLDGTDDYVSFPATAAFDFDDGDFTIETWVRFAVDPGTGNQCLFSKWAIAAGQASFFLGLRNNSLDFIYSTNGTNSFTIGQAWNPVEDVWYHVAVCRDGANVRHFIDGTQIGSTDTSISTSSINAGTDILTLGTILSGATATEVLDGWMDDVRFTKGKALYTANFTAPTEAHPKL